METKKSTSLLFTYIKEAYNHLKACEICGANGGVNDHGISLEENGKFNLICDKCLGGQLWN